MVAIGRALMTRPTLVLLDEPSMGLAPIIVEEIFEIMRQLNRDQGVSFLLAEQNANLALRYADHAYVLESGRVVAERAGKLTAVHVKVGDSVAGQAPSIAPRFPYAINLLRSNHVFACHRGKRGELQVRRGNVAVTYLPFRRTWRTSFQKGA